MSLENRLRQIRQERGLTQENLALSVGVTRQSIIAVEKGKFVPSVRLALELARALNVDVEHIFSLEPNKERTK